jgi:Ca-activated chloride channel family protein
MVQFLNPAALALLALAIPILLLWMLKLRRRDVTVSSTLLWSRLVRDREANAPWQRLRRNLLLWLQLATLLALALALARPFRPVPSVAGGAVVVVLDASASMQSTDVMPSRFSVAQRAAGDLVSGLGGDGLMTVIAAGARPRVLAAATDDRAALRTAIDGASPEAGPADWEAALALAAGATSGAAESTIVIISDGNLPADLPPLPGEVRYIPIGDPSGTPNLALTALALRGGELFTSVAYTGPPGGPAATPLLAVYLDGTLNESRRLQVASGETLPLTLTDIPATADLIEVALSDQVGPGQGDALALDDRAWAVQGGSAGARRVLVVTSGNLFLERAVAALAAVQAFRADPAAPLPAEPYDLTILDGVAPDPLPTGPLLLINPPAGQSLVPVSGVFSTTTVTQVAGHPLLAHVDFGEVQIRQAVRVEPPAWAQTLIEAEGGPLLLAGETGGRRVAVLTFDLHQSDLPLQVAFPVLMANLIDWLSPGQPFDTSAVHRPGAPVTIYPGGASLVEVVAPDGTVWTAAGDEAPVYPDAAQLGLYQVRLDGAPAGSFAVNLFDPAESTLSRAETIRVGRAEVQPGSGEELGQQSLWFWLAGAALALLLVEWWVYHRGTQLRPAPPRPDGRP